MGFFVFLSFLAMTIAILEEPIESLLPEEESTTQDTYALNLCEALRMLYLEEIFSPQGNYIPSVRPRSVSIAGLPNKPSAADLEEYLLSLCGEERRRTFQLLQKIVRNQSYAEGVPFALVMEHEDV